MKKCLWCNKELEKMLTASENDYTYTCYCKTFEPYYSCNFNFKDNNLIKVGVQLLYVNNNIYRLISWTKRNMTEFYINSTMETKLNYCINEKNMIKTFNKFLKLKSLL